MAESLWNDKYCSLMRGKKEYWRSAITQLKHGGESIMIWGCFGNNHVSDLTKMKATLRKVGYWDKVVLSDEVKWFALFLLLRAQFLVLGLSF